MKQKGRSYGEWKAMECEFWAPELKSENVCLFLRYVSGKEKYIKWFRRICQAEGK